MKRATLSVVIPLYNQADVIVEAIDSVLRQSRPPEEVVVVDDASTDSGAQVVAEYAERRARVRLIRSEENEGTPRATNKGFDAARGDYVYRLPADGLVLPGFFERHMEALEAEPRAGLSYGDFVTVTQGREILERTPSLPPRAAFYTPEELSDTLYGDVLEARSAIFRRDALLAAGGLIPELEELSDGYLGLCVAFRHGLTYVPGACHAKRVGSTSYALAREACRRDLQEKILRIVERLERPENADLASHFARSAAFVHFGIAAAEAFFRAPDRASPQRALLLAEPVREYLRRKRDRVRRAARPRNRPRFFSGDDVPRSRSLVAPNEKHPAQQDAAFERRAMVRRVSELVADWNRRSRRVVLYGAGEETSNLFKWTDLARADLVAIAEPAALLQGKRLWDLETVAPEAISSLPADTVLICERDPRGEIRNHLAALERYGFEVVSLSDAARPLDQRPRWSAAPPPAP